MAERSDGARRYYCRECEASCGLLTQDEALAEIANGHTLFADPEPMPVADAIADAETLILFMRSGREFCGLRYCEGWSLSFCDLSAGARKHARRGWAHRAAAAAMLGAREAFKAVPGLRAEAA